MIDWKYVENSDDLYKISSDGKLFSIRSNRILKGEATRLGYIRMSLIIQGKRKRILLHRLVAKAFVKNNNNKNEVNHIDGNKRNNLAENLEWVTRSENIKHAFYIGLMQKKFGEDTNNAKITMEIARKIRIDPISQREASIKYNISASTISCIRQNKIWKE